VVAACGSPVLLSPAPPTPTPVPTPQPVTEFPPLSGPARTFKFERKLARSVREYTRRSQFVLYDNGAFALQIAHRFDREDRDGERGAYQEESGFVTFEWENRSSGDAWGATGILQGDSLEVRYNLIMWELGFDDARYVLVQ
jgi:hypothetical protein